MATESDSRIWRRSFCACRRIFPTSCTWCAEAAAASPATGAEPGMPGCGVARPSRPPPQRPSRVEPQQVCPGIPTDLEREERDGRAASEEYARRACRVRAKAFRDEEQPPSPGAGLAPADLASEWIDESDEEDEEGEWPPAAARQRAARRAAHRGGGGGCRRAVRRRGAAETANVTETHFEPQMPTNPHKRRGPCPSAAAWAESPPSPVARPS